MLGFRHIGHTKLKNMVSLSKLLHCHKHIRQYAIHLSIMREILNGLFRNAQAFILLVHDHQNVYLTQPRLNPVRLQLGCPAIILSRIIQQAQLLITGAHMWRLWDAIKRQ